MGAWPSDDLTKAHLDAATDDPSQARVELVALIDKVKVMIAGLESANTVNAGVKRDSSGNFSAGTITAALTGTASQATNADTLDSQHGSYYQNSTNQTAGTLPDARLSTNVLTKSNAPLNTVTSAANSSLVTVLSTTTTLVTRSLGTVTVGDVFLATFRIVGTKGGTGGEVFTGITKDSGTATIVFNHSSNSVNSKEDVVTASNTYYTTMSSIITVTVTGTLTLKTFGHSDNSDLTVSIGGADIAVVQLYNA